MPTALQSLPLVDSFYVCRYRCGYINSDSKKKKVPPIAEARSVPSVGAPRQLRTPNIRTCMSCHQKYDSASKTLRRATILRSLFCGPKRKSSKVSTWEPLNTQHPAYDAPMARLASSLNAISFDVAYLRMCAKNILFSAPIAENDHHG